MTISVSIPTIVAEKEKLTASTQVDGMKKFHDASRALKVGLEDLRQRTRWERDEPLERGGKQRLEGGDCDPRIFESTLIRNSYSRK